MKADFFNRTPTAIIAGFLAKHLPICVLLVFFSLTCPAKTVVLTEQSPVTRLNKQAEFYEDKTGSLTIGDLTSGKGGNLFKATDLEKLIFVNTKSTFWFRFTALDKDKDAMPSILELRYHNYDSIDLYTVNPDHTYTQELQGDLVPYNSRRLKSNSFAFFLNSPPGQATEYYVRIRCHEVAKFHFTVYDYKAFYKHSLLSSLIVGGLLMTFLAMFLSNFFIMLFSGNKGHAFYLVMIVSAFGYALVINGVGFHYLWPNHPRFQHIGEYVFSFMGNPALTLFTQSFLKTREAYPKANKVLNALLGIWALSLLVALAFGLPLGILGLISAALGMVNAIVILTLAVIALSQKYEPALFFLAGMSCSLIAIIIYYLMFIGYVNLSFNSFYLPQLLMVTDTVLLSIALSENVRRMRDEITTAHIEKRNYLLEINRMKENANIELQSQVRERTAELEAVNKELEAFSYSVSHDLKAPLRGIKGYAHILRQHAGEKLGEQEGEMVGKIEFIAGKMNNLISDLLVLSQVAKSDLQKTVFNPAELTAAICKDLIKGKSNMPQMIAKPMHDILADKALMQYVFNNLISNAVKYSSKNEHPVIEIGTEEQDGQTVFYVKDNGAGFDMEYADKLFQPFQRLHGPEEFEGTGIGLSIVKRIIDRHGGKVWAESEPDKGATFYFAIPAKKRVAGKCAFGDLRL